MMTHFYRVLGFTMACLLKLIVNPSHLVTFTTPRLCLLSYIFTIPFLTFSL